MSSIIVCLVSHFNENLNTINFYKDFLKVEYYYGYFVMLTRIAVNLKNIHQRITEILPLI